MKSNGLTNDLTKCTTSLRTWVFKGDGAADAASKKWHNREIERRMTMKKRSFLFAFGLALLFTIASVAGLYAAEQKPIEWKFQDT